MTVPGGRLRIGMVCFAGYGGSGVVATELGRELAKRGHKVHFISRQMPFRLQQAEFFENIYYHEVDSMTYDVQPGGSYGLEMASKLTQIVQDENLDVLHAHYAVPHAIASLLARDVLASKSLRVVTTLHGTDITLVGSAPAFFPLTQWSIERCDAVTAVSAWLRDETVTTFQTRRPIDVIGNFVDSERFKPCHTCLDREKFAEPGERIILHTSNFRPVKRVTDVVKVFAEVVKQVPARLIFIGDGPDRERAFQAARNLGVMNRTYFLGKQNQVENYYGIADLFLFPSEYESFGVAALEAMSTGVPVIATEGSGLAEVVRDGETGFLCPLGDVKGMTEAALRIFGDADLEKRLRARGREVAVGEFQPGHAVEKYLEVYRRVLAAEPFAASAA